MSVGVLFLPNIIVKFLSSLFSRFVVDLLLKIIFFIITQFQKSVVRDALLMYGDALKGEIKQAIENNKTPFMTEGFVDMQIAELLETLKIVKG